MPFFKWWSIKRKLETWLNVTDTSLESKSTHKICTRQKQELQEVLLQYYFYTKAHTQTAEHTALGWDFNKSAQPDTLTCTNPDMQRSCHAALSSQAVQIPDGKDEVRSFASTAPPTTAIAVM